MRSTWNRLVALFCCEEGPTVTEYAVMMALIALAFVITLVVMGNKVSGTFSLLGSQVPGGSGS